MTGAGGLLGLRLAAELADRYRCFLHYHHPPDGYDSGAKDVLVGDLVDEAYIEQLARRIDPEVIVNSAALADVDLCETEQEKSYNINVRAVERLMQYFPNARLMQISTDYIFADDDRHRTTPPTPDDRPYPVNIYGLHKMFAERAVTDASPRHAIVRVNTLFDHTRPRNFFRFVYDNLSVGKKITGATDQVSNPIAAFSAAALIVKLIDMKAEGIYHLGGREHLSRYEFAGRIAAFFDLDQTLIEPVLTDDLARPAGRLRRAGLDCRTTEKYLQVSMPEMDDEFSRIKEELRRKDG